MISASSFEHAYIACGVTDLRKSIDGLAAIVQESFRLDPFANCFFVFCNRKRDKIKILHWEHNGFWLYYKRLEKGKFQWPENSESLTISVGKRELNWLLDGLSLEQKQAHPKVSANIVI